MCIGIEGTAPGVEQGKELSLLVEEWSSPKSCKVRADAGRPAACYIYAKFGGSLKILSDNGTEFKNKLFENIAKQLGVKYKKYTPPCLPQMVTSKAFTTFLRPAFPNTLVCS